MSNVVTRRGTPLRISIVAAVGERYAGYLRRNLRRASDLIPSRPLRELSVALVNDRTMSTLHKQFMNIDGPTDVLTFPLEFAPRSRTKAIAGEVVVCVPEAARRAKEQGTGVERELLLYALHGMLHLCGYDDRTAPGYARMHRTEDSILSRIGVGPVFHVRPKQGHSRRESLR